MLESTKQLIDPGPAATFVSDDVGFAWSRGEAFRAWRAADAESAASERAIADAELGGQPWFGLGGTAPGAFPSLRQWLVDRGADRYPHAVGTFLDHLVGTWQILSLWEQPARVRHCGLFHSVYSTDMYAQALLAPTERVALQRLIGAESEAMTLLFCTIDRLELAVAYADLERLPGDGLEVVNHRTGERARLPRAAISELLIVEMANVAEQSGDSSTGPGHWMTLCAHLGRLVAGNVACVPPVFDHCSNTLTDRDEQRARQLYLQATAQRPAEAQVESDLREACRLNPWVGEPRILLAQLALQAGRCDEALRHAETALIRLCQWGSAWDKRRSWVEWVAAAQAVRSRAAVSD